jgi:hypothetical protein
MNRMRAAAVATALLAFVANPGFGCGEDFTFGETEMRQAVEGTYDLSLPGDATPRATFSLRFGNSDLSSVQQAHCSNRTFVASAGACSPSTSMSLVGNVVAGIASYQGQKLNGYFNVYGYQYQGGSLHVVFDHGPRVTARVSSTNELTDVTLTEGMTAPQAAMLVRKR